MRNATALLMLCTIFLLSGISTDCFAAEESSSQTEEVTMRSITLKVEVPEETDVVFVTGNLKLLGPWAPEEFAMSGEGTERTAVLEIPQGYDFEFKFTLGSWDHEALNEDDSVPDNHQLTVTEDATLEFQIAKFGDRDQGALEKPTQDGSGVLGTLIYQYDVKSKYLEHARHVVVWLPPGYQTDTKRTYPVLYMHDGQNIFDPRLSFTGVDWGVDEAIVRLVEAGKIPPIIVVGTFNSKDRGYDYDPFQGGEAFARFLVEEVKPGIDATYRTRPEAKYTGTMGSSLGGLISLGLGWKHPDVFTRLGCLSAHLEVMTEERGGTGRSILDEIEEEGGLNRDLRIYVDRSSGGGDENYAPTHERFEKMLADWGWIDGEDYLFRADFENSIHSESSWRERLHVPLEFLFADLVNDPALK